MAAKPLTPAQRGKLGGLAAARAMTPEERSARSRKAGTAVLDRYGVEHFVRAAHARHGRKVASVKQLEESKS